MGHTKIGETHNIWYFRRAQNRGARKWNFAKYVNEEKLWYSKFNAKLNISMR